jgi:hypothetical protein
VVVWLGQPAISDVLTQLSLAGPLYASISERLLERKRQVRSFTTQTTDPAEE